MFNLFIIKVKLSLLFFLCKLLIAVGTLGIEYDAGNILFDFRGLDLLLKESPELRAVVGQIHALAGPGGQHHSVGKGQAVDAFVAGSKQRLALKKVICKVLSDTLMLRKHVVFGSHDLCSCRKLLEAFFSLEAPLSFVTVVLCPSKSLAFSNELFELYEAFPEKRTQAVASGGAVKKNEILKYLISDTFGMQTSVSALKEEASTGVALFSSFVAGRADYDNGFGKYLKE